MALRKFSICLSPELEDEVFEAEGYWFDEDKGTLKLLIDRKPVVMFPKGAWQFMKELGDGESS